MPPPTEEWNRSDHLPSGVSRAADGCPWPAHSAGQRPPASLPLPLRGARPLRERHPSRRGRRGGAPLPRDGDRGRAARLRGRTRGWWICPTIPSTPPSTRKIAKSWTTCSSRGGATARRPGDPEGLLDKALRLRKPADLAKCLRELRSLNATFMRMGGAATPS